jgi:hypothetical protein
MRVVSLVLVSSALILAFEATALVRAARATDEANGPNAVFILDEDAKPPMIVLRTARLGVAGSRIVVTVDHVRKPVFSHIFGPGQCKFGDTGSDCEVIIPPMDVAYRTILARFKHGRLARVTVQDAGVHEVDQTVSLSGFAHALR